MATSTNNNNVIVPSPKLHVVMFPWFAFGHFTPYLHLSNKLAERGHRVSFILPKKPIDQLQSNNLHPELITFHPLTLPPVQGLSPDAETASDVPYSSHKLLAKAMDLTRDEFKALVSTLAPDFVFYDLAHWVPEVASALGVKAVMYIVSAATCVYPLVTAGTNELHPSEGWPEELSLEFGMGVTLGDRIQTALTRSDAVCFRTCTEVEGDVVEKFKETLAKPVLLTGPALPEEDGSMLDPKWKRWLNTLSSSSNVIFCSLGSQQVLDKDEFQELALGFEATGLPFLAVLKPPIGCSSIDEALPEGLEERVSSRGVIYDGWVQQTSILKHPSIGCFVCHCGFGTMWEALVSECQIVALPFLPEHFINAEILAEEMNVAVVAKREEGHGGRISKETICEAIKCVMDEVSEVGLTVRKNHLKYREVLTKKGFMSGYLDNFVEDLRKLKNL